MTFTYIKLHTMDEVTQGLVGAEDNGFQVVTKDYTQDQMNDFRFFTATFLDGGYMEAVHPVTLPTLGDLLGDKAYDKYRLVMMVDDEGHMKNLSANIMATVIYQAGVVVGPAILLCSKRDYLEGDILVSFPEAAVDALRPALIHLLRVLMENYA